MLELVSFSLMTLNVALSCVTVPRMILYSSSSSPIPDCKRKQASRIEEKNVLSGAYALEHYTPGRAVTLKWDGSFYSGTVYRILVEQKSCFVDFEGEEDQYIVPWTALKIRDVAEEMDEGDKENLIEGKEKRVVKEKSGWKSGDSQLVYY
jgi:hypothetical protein